MSVSPRSAVVPINVVHHGGIRYGELAAEGTAPDEIIDFSVSVNPIRPPVEVIQAMTNSNIGRYPDSLAGALRETIGFVHRTRPENVLLTHGATEAIRLIPLAYVDAGENCLIVAPTYGEYQAACELMGGRVGQVRSDQSDGFRVKLEELNLAIEKNNPKLVWLCNPNNPTGQYLAEQEVCVILQACEAANSLLVVDEAYASFADSDRNSAVFLDSQNCVLLRSMTKDFSAPGLRLGYMLAHQRLIETLVKVKPPWNIGAPEQEAGLEILRHREYYEVSWRRLAGLGRDLRNALAGVGLDVLPSSTNFFLIRLGDRKAQAIDFLRSDKIQVRDCASFGLPGFIRVGTRLAQDNSRLVDGLKKFIKKTGA